MYERIKHKNFFNMIQLVVQQSIYTIILFTILERILIIAWMIFTIEMLQEELSSIEIFSEDGYISS